MSTSGEEKAWELLKGLAPAEVEKRASVRYESGRGCYLLPSLGMEVSVCPGERGISAPAPDRDALIKRHT
jgi:hypothetical protein